MERIFKRRRGKRSCRGDFDTGRINWRSCDFPQAVTGACQRSDEFCGEQGKSGGIRDGKRRSASVTVPLCLALVMLSALLFTLAESARHYGLKADAEDLTNLALESLFAGYQRTLFREYGMFFLDGGFGTKDLDPDLAEDEMSARLYDNFISDEPGRGINLYRMGALDVEVEAYRLAADENGNVFERQAAEAMKREIGLRAAQNIKNRILRVEEEQKQANDGQECIKQAEDALSELKSQQEQERMEGDNAQQPSVQDGPESSLPAEAPAENPLDFIKKLKRQGILLLVFPADRTISQKSAAIEQALLKRDVAQGCFKQAEAPGWYERILMQEFIKPYVGHAAAPKEDGALSYGVEYLLFGKGSDEENLKKTVRRILLIREAANFAYLQTDEAKRAEALAAATAIAGVSANPLVIGVVRQGILAAWAYVESICDVKALLAGGKIPLLKNAASWQSSVFHLGEAVAGTYAGEAEGLSYEKYLDVLLYAKPVKQIAYRSMDLMEWRMQKENGLQDFRMDRMIVGIKLRAAYETEPLFFGFFGGRNNINWHFSTKAEYVYEQ